MRDPVKTNRVTPNELDKIDQLMIEAFPEAERSLAIELFQMTDKDECVDFSAHYVADEFCGFSFVINKFGFTFIYYIAVAEKWRGRGIGTEILEQIRNRPSGIFILNVESLETECDNYAQRKRRLDFYMRFGIGLTGFRLVHDGVEYDILASSPLTLSDISDYKKLLSSISEEYDKDKIYEYSESIV